MRSAQSSVKLSVEEFEVYPTPDGKAELVRGELRLSPPPGSPHGLVVARVAQLLSNHVMERRLGAVLTDAGFELLQLPRTVRAPDIAFVRADRLPARGISRGFLRMAPDLDVEVVSPSETRKELEEKLSDYRASGVPVVWVIDPEERTVRVIAGARTVQLLVKHETLDGGSVVPGFSCGVAELFVGLADD